MRNFEILECQLSKGIGLCETMEILAEGFETNPRNFARFVVVGISLSVEISAAKSSIVFSTFNQPGALMEVMKAFANNRINMVKLESRPFHG